MGLADFAHAAERACPAAPQPMPPAIESADLPPSNGFNNIITFSATPMLQYPQRAWVLRLFQRTRGQPATLTVVRLRGRDECNIYDIEARWEVPLRADEYETVAALITPHVTPPPGVFDQRDIVRERDPVLDGTGVDLRAETWGWQVERSLNLAETEGYALSSIFYRLLDPAVPAAERPDADWRTPR
jgi:hypothetical protein